MSDKIEKIGDSVVQYGPHNDRINVMELSVHDMPDIVYNLIDMARKNKYSKIFIKVPEYAIDNFLNAGYVIEAHVPGFFEGYESGYFMAKYLDKSRGRGDEKQHRGGRACESTVDRWQVEDAIHCEKVLYSIRRGRRMRKSLPGVYGKVFSTYPFPIHDAAYLCKRWRQT